MNAPNSVRATFEIVTPMFLGGADQQAGGIRAQSLKGELAFWWRALHFEEYMRGRGIESALRDMYADELILFGGPKRQGAFLLSVENVQIDVRQKGKILLRDGRAGEPSIEGRDRSHPELVGVGARYLGYGVLEAFSQRTLSEDVWIPANIKAYAGRLMRSCLAPRGTFEAVVRFRPLPLREGKFGDYDRQAHERMKNGLGDGLIRALKLTGLLGGLGSRKRRGWGSLVIAEMDGVDWSPPATLEAHQKQLAELIGRRTVSGADWPLTAFASQSRIWRADGNSTSGLDALNRLGGAFLNYRANGQGTSTTVGGVTIQKQFQEDHDWFRLGATSVDIPYRSAFGLPHMYNSKNGDGVTPANNNQDRRASPMLFHVHKSGSEYSGIVTLFPTKFIEGDLAATRSSGADTRRNYSLHNAYGAKATSGHNVLLDFVGKGSGKFSANSLLTFAGVFP